MSRVEAAGKVLGRFLGGLGNGLRAGMANAPAEKAPRPELAYRVSLLEKDLSAEQRAPLQVMASSPESAAEKRAMKPALEADASGNYKNRTYSALVEWPDGQRHVTVSIVRLLKAEAVSPEKGGAKWGA